MNVLPVGDDALLVEVSSGEEAEAWHAELSRRRAEGRLVVREIVPAARTVLLDGLADPVGLASELTAAEVPPAPPRAGDVVEIPVRYDGPDLAEVAGHWGVAADEVARVHAGTEFRVSFCGFAPGFGYLTGLPARYAVPRPQPDPGHTVRLEVPQGRAGRGEGEVGRGVHGAVAPPGGRLARPRVRTRVAGEVGLVAGHGRDAEPGGGGHATDAEDEGPRQVDEVGAVLGDRGRDPPTGQGDADLRVAGEREGGDPDDAARSVRVPLVGGGGGRRDDDAVVTAVHEVPGGLERAVGDAVDIGGKGFGHDDDSHTGVVAGLDVLASTSIFRPRKVP
ncbi:allophanate hydrolase subunit 1 [Streptomyces tendae]